MEGGNRSRVPLQQGALIFVKANWFSGFSLKITETFCSNRQKPDVFSNLSNFVSVLHLTFPDITILEAKISHRSCLLYCFSNMLIHASF